MGSSDKNGRIELERTLQVVESLNLDVNTFLEIGSKDGKDSLFMKEKLKLKDENIFIMEAHPEFYKNIKTNFPTFNCYNFAAWNENGELFFNAALNSDDGRSSLLDRDIYSENFKKVKIDCKRVDVMMEEYFKKSIDLVKIDVEGAAYEVLEGFGENIKNIKVFQIEAEQYKIWDEQKTSLEVYGLLNSKGFFKVWEIKLAKTQTDTIWVNMNEN